MFYNENMVLANQIKVVRLSKTFCNTRQNHAKANCRLGSRQVPGRTNISTQNVFGGVNEIGLYARH